MLFGKYASSRSEAKFKSLWNRIEVAIAPKLASPTGGIAYDYSGYNASTMSVASPSTAWGRAFSNNYISGRFVASGNKQSVFNGATKASISGWVQPVSDQFSIGFSSGGSTRFCILNAFGLLFALAEDNSGDAYRYGSVITGNTLTHVAMNFDGTQSTAATRLRLWVNGVEASLPSTVGTIPASLGSLGPWSLGDHIGGVNVGGRYFEAFAHRRLLTFSEIALLAKTPSAMFIPTKNIYGGNAVNRRRRLLVGASS